MELSPGKFPTGTWGRSSGRVGGRGEEKRKHGQQVDVQGESQEVPQASSETPFHGTNEFTEAGPWVVPSARFTACL